MVHAPLRGLIALTRLGLVVAAVAAIPVILKKSKPVADKVGDALIDFGKKLKEGEKKAEPSKATTATKDSPKAASEVKQSRPKKSAAKKATARKKPTRKA